jgi:hypothetical protein
MKISKLIPCAIIYGVVASNCHASPETVVRFAANNSNKPVTHEDLSDPSRCSTYVELRSISALLDVLGPFTNAPAQESNPVNVLATLEDGKRVVPLRNATVIELLRKRFSPFLELASLGEAYRLSNPDTNTVGEMISMRFSRNIDGRTDRVVIHFDSPVRFNPRQIVTQLESKAGTWVCAIVDQHTHHEYTFSTDISAIDAFVLSVRQAVAALPHTHSKEYMHQSWLTNECRSLQILVHAAIQKMPTRRHSRAELLPTWPSCPAGGEISISGVCTVHGDLLATQQAQAVPVVKHR